MNVRTVAVAVVALIIGLILGQTLFAHASSSSSSSRFLTAYATDNVTFPAIDLFCTGMRHDPDGIEAGPILFCGRSSTNRARNVVISRFHYIVTRPDGTLSYRVARSP